MSLRRQDRGFTLIELLVVIAIIAILAAILFPVFARARENARKATCLSNLKQLGQAVQMYNQDYDEKFASADYYDSKASPAGMFWASCLYPYVKNYQVYNCLTGGGRGSSKAFSYNSWTFPVSPDYGWNTYLNRVAEAAVTKPAETVAVAETSHQVFCDHVGRIAWANSQDGILFPPSGKTKADFMIERYSRHMGGENIAFADGHVKWMPSQAIWAAGNANLLYATR